MLGLLAAAGFVALLISVIVAPNLHLLFGDFARMHFRPIFGITFLLVYLVVLRWLWRYTARKQDKTQ